MNEKVIYNVCSFHIKNNSIKSKFPSQEDRIDEERIEKGSPFIFCRYCRQNMIITDKEYDKEYDIKKINEDTDDEDDEHDKNNEKTRVSFLKRKRNDYIKLLT